MVLLAFHLAVDMGVVCAAKDIVDADIEIVGQPDERICGGKPFAGLIFG